MNNRHITYHTIESLMANTVEEGDCLLWQGYMASKAVPHVSHGGKIVAVRRLMLELRGRPLKRTDYVGCSCGNKSCISPAHTVQRTQAQHVAAMGRSPNRRRLARASKLAAYARANRAKLTIEQAREIRVSSETGPVLSAKYGVNKALINRIKRGETWREYSTPFSGL